MAGNILLLGYQAAASNVLTTELNSLADGNVCALSSAVDNSSTLLKYADFQLDLASLTISSATAYVSLFIVPTVDGSNYPDFTSGAAANYHGQYYVAPLTFKVVTTTAVRANVSKVPLPPGLFKVSVRNGLGVSMASSGNTLAIRTYADSYT